MILESMANAYDMFIQPRDISKVQQYNNMLLKENPKMDKEKRKKKETGSAHGSMMVACLKAWAKGNGR